MKINEPQERRIMEMPETVGFIKLMNEDITYDKLVTSNEKKLMMVLRLKHNRRLDEKNKKHPKHFQFIKEYYSAFIFFKFGRCAFTGAIVYNDIMVKQTNEEMENYKSQ